MSQSSSEESVIEVQSIESGRIMAGIIGNMDPFDDTGEQWATYIERFEHYILANEIRTVKKVPVLFSVMGPKTYGLLCSLVAPDKPGLWTCCGRVASPFRSKTARDSGKIPFPQAKSGGRGNRCTVCCGTEKNVLSIVSSVLF